MAKKLKAAAELGRRGGKKKVPKGFSKMAPGKRKAVARKGVVARLKKSTPEQRRAIAKNAAAKRWGKRGQE